MACCRNRVRGGLVVNAFASQRQGWGFQFLPLPCVWSLNVLRVLGWMVEISVAFCREQIRSKTIKGQREKTT